MLRRRPGFVTIISSAVVLLDFTMLFQWLNSICSCNESVHCVREGESAWKDQATNLQNLHSHWPWTLTVSLMSIMNHRYIDFCPRSLHSPTTTEVRLHLNRYWRLHSLLFKKPAKKCLCHPLSIFINGSQRTQTNSSLLWTTFVSILEKTILLWLWVDPMSGMTTTWMKQRQVIVENRSLFIIVCLLSFAN